MEENQSVTITLSECVENHERMAQIGEMAKDGFTFDDLQKAKTLFEAQGIKCEMHYLNPYIPGENTSGGYVLVVKNGVDAFVDLDKLEKEAAENSKKFDDKKALIRGKVVNKNARWNHCISDHESNADYEKGHGTVISFEMCQHLSKIREKMPIYLGYKSRCMFAEVNNYYDVEKCGIGFHGDSERKRVVGIRLGKKTAPLHFQWFKDSIPIGKRFVIPLSRGDMYVMSEKATGNDWKKRSIPTLRHATGCSKFTSIKNKIKK